MKTRIKRLQRWLDMLSAACDNKHWDSALVETDCLNAEVQELRREIWETLQNPSSAKNSIFTRDALSLSLRTTVIAMVIVLLSTIPIAVESGKPWIPATITSHNQEKEQTLNWVTDDELALLHVIRADLSDKNLLQPLSKQASSRKETVKTARSAKNIDFIQQKSELNVESDVTIAPEELISLIQVGEKALRTDTQAIRVMK